MCRPPRRAPLCLWVLACVLTLLSVPLAALTALVALAAPASADTVTPTRHCRHGGDYRELEGDSTVVVTAPEGYLIESYCVDGRGRRAGSEVHTLSSPQPTTIIWHSNSRAIEGYSVEYTRTPASEEPDTDPEEPEAEQGPNDQNPNDQDPNDQDPNDQSAGATAVPDAQQGTTAPVEEAGTAGKGENPERTSPTAAPTPTPEPRGQASEGVPGQPDGSARMSPLSDGEELRTTSLKAVEDDEETDDLRSLVVAGGIVILGLLAGMVALLVRLPGQR